MQEFEDITIYNHSKVSKRTHKEGEASLYVIVEQPATHPFVLYRHQSKNKAAGRVISCWAFRTLNLELLARLETDLCEDDDRWLNRNT